MAAPEIKGKNGMTRTESGRRWTAESGEIEYEVWQGPALAAMAFYLKEKNYEDWDAVDISDFPVRTVKLERAVVDDSSNKPIWEAVGVELQKPIEEHPYFNIGSPGISEDWAVIKQSIDKALRNGTKYTVPEAEEHMCRYKGLRYAGVDSYNDIYIVLRKTEIVASRNVLITAQWENVNIVVPFENIAPPDYIIGQIMEIRRLKDHFPDPVILGDYEPGKWEWLTKIPVVRAESGGKKFSIVSEWWGAEKWSKVFYGGNWDPTIP
jgi:hypothetical protein